LAPNVRVLTDENLRPELREQIQTRLDRWMAQRIEAKLEPLMALRRAADVKAGSAVALVADARGIAHQLCEALGSVAHNDATLPPDVRAAQRDLRGFGIKFARRSIYLPKLIRPDAAALLALLWAVKRGLDHIPPAPQAGLTSFEIDEETPHGFLEAAGFRVMGNRAVRLDILDRLEDELELAAKEGRNTDAVSLKLVSFLGADAPTLERILGKLGWRKLDVAGEQPTSVWRHKADNQPPQQRREHPRKSKSGHKPKPQVKIDPDSPFAKLASLVTAK
jgi:ATP-dependent RNA helicase SUPV3L1/SUV3